ncbi:MAG: flavin reductase family protein, partial [Clostridia bacterium]|nr:flavin reductase family protein [Clostridia bacterium]
SQSGRDIDKTALTGLVPVFDEKGVYFEQARMVIICKKQYVQPMRKEYFTDEEPLSCYRENDFHYMVFGRIEKVLVKG